MTKEEILAMEAGRELNALVDEEIMHTIYELHGRKFYGTGTEFPPAYSTGISAAWQVIEKLMEQYNIKLQTRGNEIWFGIYNFYFDRHVETEELITEVVADTAPEAICKAALLARDLEKPMVAERAKGREKPRTGERAIVEEKPRTRERARELEKPKGHERAKYLEKPKEYERATDIE